MARKYLNYCGKNMSILKKKLNTINNKELIKTVKYIGKPKARTFVFVNYYTQSKYLLGK